MIEEIDRELAPLSSPNAQPFGANMPVPTSVKSESECGSYDSASSVESASDVVSCASLRSSLAGESSSNNS